MPDGAKVLTDYGVSTETGFIGVSKQITDQAGKTRKGISDALGRMVRVIEDPTGQNPSTDYVFDTLGNLRKTTQGEQSRFFMHDSLGRLLYAKQPEQTANAYFSGTNYTDAITGNNQWSVNYVYDDNGNITSTTDAGNVSVTGSYDNFNRLKVRTYSDATPEVKFYYDGKYLNIYDQVQMATGSVKGKTTGIKSSVSRTNYTTFNNLGQLTAYQQITDGQTYNTGYNYDAFGRIISETYPSGRTVKVDYNSEGDVSSIYGTVGTQNRLYANGFSYNSAGAIERMRLGNGKWETYAYNNRLQIIEIGLGHSATDRSLLKLEYSYGTATENNGNLRTQKISFNGLAQPFEQTYTYDSLNRLHDAKETVNGLQTWKQTFDYDRYGNRRFDAANTTTLGSCSQAECNPLINTSDNRFSSGQNYSYDANGNVTTDTIGKQFLYDAENHQKEVRNVANQPIGEYLYDGGGKRIKKISATETTVFVYNGGGRLVAEYSTATVTTPQVSYLTADHLGSPRVITNQNGAVTTRKDYMAFGDEASSAQRTANPNYDSSETRKGYTGYEKDGESGLEFAQARYYNATHGRFTSVDPLTASASVKNPQTFNRYSYVLNSPYKFVDPLGLISSTTGACGQWCQNSGGSVDGSAFRGRDASFDWAQQTQQQDTNIHESIHIISPNNDSIELVNTTKTTYYYYRNIRGGASGTFGATENETVTISWEARVGVLKINGEVTDIVAYEAMGLIEAVIFDLNTGKENKERSKQLTELLRREGDNSTNCHGQTFTGGKYWVDNPQVEKLATKLGYEKLISSDKAQVGDVGVYSTDGNLASNRHSFTVSSVSSSGVSGVVSKGGIQKLQSNVPVNSKMWYLHDSQKINYYRRNLKVN